MNIIYYREVGTLVLTMSVSEFERIKEITDAVQASGLLPSGCNSLVCVEVISYGELVELSIGKGELQYGVLMLKHMFDTPYIDVDKKTDVMELITNHMEPMIQEAVK